jgi:hypothetical protein
MGGTCEGLASQTLTLVSGALYDQFMKKKVKSYDICQNSVILDSIFKSECIFNGKFSHFTCQKKRRSTETNYFYLFQTTYRFNSLNMNITFKRFM